MKKIYKREKGRKKRERERKWEKIEKKRDRERKRNREKERELKHMTKFLAFLHTNKFAKKKGANL